MFLRIVKYLLKTASGLFIKAEKKSVDDMRDIWRQAGTVCILAASGIGDSIMATPLIAEIKRRRPGMRVVVISTDSFAQVFERNPDVDQMLTYNYSTMSFMKLLSELRREKIDVFLSAQPANTIRHSLIVGLSGALLRLKHKYDYGEAVERDFSFVYNTLLPDSMARHRVELNLDFIRFLGEAVVERSIFPRFFVSEKASLVVAKQIEIVLGNSAKNRIVALHPGGLRSEKKWPSDKFAQLASHLDSKGRTVFVVGTEQEKEDAEIISALTKGVIDVTGRFNLDETAALIKRCDFLVSNDTGIMHLATAVGTPVVAVFGPTDFRHIGPYGMHVETVSKGNSINDVTAADVLKIVERDILSMGHSVCCER